MSRNIRITAGPVEMEAVLNNANTAQAVWNALPITAAANTWGDEIYFGIPVNADLEQGREVVELGDLGH